MEVKVDNKCPNCKRVAKVSTNLCFKHNPIKNCTKWKEGNHTHYFCCGIWWIVMED